ncbi:hypothetical protein EDB83DRAFT_2325124 [Lactarius deliciosus]|nr:hypothetical protein EDB83DRAFT_2325124 [Lactarius deliciosus]
MPHSCCTEPSPCEFVGGGDPAGVTEEERKAESAAFATVTAGANANGLRRERRGEVMRDETRQDENFASLILRVPAVGPDFRDKHTELKGETMATGRSLYSAEVRCFKYKRTLATSEPK